MYPYDIGVFFVIAMSCSISARDAKAVAKKAKQMKKNAKKGKQREKKGLADLEEQFPDASVQKEQYPRDADGKILKDPLTGKARRVDAAVIEDDKAKTFEITGPAVDKTQQKTKERRILDEGGVYIRDRRKRNLCQVEGVCERLDIE